MIGQDLSIIAPIASEKVPHGIVLGKFMPPTLGHQYLVDVARGSCRELTIVVGTMPDEPIPGVLRYEWMKEMFPDCRVVHLDRVMPQAPSHPDDRDFFDLWAKTLYECAGASEIDALFASESYGYKVADAMGVRYIPVDPERQSVMISATAIREDALLHWDKLPAVVRPYFVRHVRLDGGDYQQRRQVAEALSVLLSTVFVDDYRMLLLRDFQRHLQAYPQELRPEDAVTAERAQRAADHALARQARRILVTIAPGGKADLVIDLAKMPCVQDIAAYVCQHWPVVTSKKDH